MQESMGDSMLLDHQNLSKAGPECSGATPSLIPSCIATRSNLKTAGKVQQTEAFDSILSASPQGSSRKVDRVSSPIGPCFVSCYVDKRKDTLRTLRERGRKKGSQGQIKMETTWLGNG